MMGFPSAPKISRTKTFETWVIKKNKKKYIYSPKWIYGKKTRPNRILRVL